MKRSLAGNIGLPPFSQKKAGKTAVKIQQLILQATEAGGQGLTDEEREIFYRALFQIADNLSALLTNLSK